MQAIGETLFDVVYLVLVVAVGIKMIRESKDHSSSVFLALWLSL